MCGTALPMIDDDFNVGESLPETKTNLTDGQQVEYESLAYLGRKHSSYVKTVSLLL